MVVDTQSSKHSFQSMASRAWLPKHSFRSMVSGERLAMLSQRLMSFGSVLPQSHQRVPCPATISFFGLQVAGLTDKKKNAADTHSGL